MVISAAGAVDHGALVAAAEKAFAKLPSGGKSAGDLVKEVRRMGPHASRRAAPVAPTGAQAGAKGSYIADELPTSMACMKRSHAQPGDTAL